jgi:modification methylase
VQGLPACNGWTFWHHDGAGKPEPIDTLRSAYRLAMARAA